MNDTGRPVVVLVHGLWFGAWAMGLLAWRLGRAGFDVQRFRYSTTRAPLSRHAAALRAFVNGLDRPPMFLAHSLGGLLTLEMLSSANEFAACRAVLLGSPLRGSVAARKASRIPGLRRLLGEAGTALLENRAALVLPSAVGVIAGTRSLGLGWLVGGLGGPGDGTVALRETRVDGLADYLELPVTHTGMLLSKRVASAAVRFLQSGQFEPRG